MKIAIITGASSGIGKEFCHQLDFGFYDEIWGVALESEKLEQTASELQTKFRSFACDLTKNEAFEAIEEALKKEKPEVELLVNCSGFGKFGRHDEIPLHQTENMIDLNCKALVKLTELVLPYMKKGSHIAEIASVASFQPLPYFAVYGATKAFVVSYSRAMNIELKSKGISVTAVCPNWTRTNFFEVAKNQHTETINKFAVMYDPTDVVQKAIKDIRKGKDLSIYGAMSKFQQFVAKFLPHKLMIKLWLKQQNISKKYPK